MNIKKQLKSPTLWTVQVILFGFVFGVPFIVSGFNYYVMISKITSWYEIIIGLLATFIVGIFIELYLRKAKLI